MVSKQTAQLPQVLADAAVGEPGEFDKLGTWSEEKKKEFCQTFEQRTSFALGAVHATAKILFKEAMGRHFVSATKSMVDFPSTITLGHFEVNWSGNKISDLTLNMHCHGQGGYGSRSHDFKKETGRTIEELQEVVKTRLEALIYELPASIDVVRVVKPQTAQHMQELKALETRHTAAKDKINELGRPVSMDEFTGKGILLDDFVKQAKQRQKSKHAWVFKLGQLNSEVSDLRSKVNKSLYQGIPELEKLTLQTINDLREQAFALEKLNRRVGETVKFGDSDAAMSALEQFERDEVQLAPAIEARFKGLVGQLRAKYHLKAGKRGKATTKAAKVTKKTKVKRKR